MNSHGCSHSGLGLQCHFDRIIIYHYIECISLLSGERIDHSIDYYSEIAIDIQLLVILDFDCIECLLIKHSTCSFYGLEIIRELATKSIKCEACWKPDLKCPILLDPVTRLEIELILDFSADHFGSAFDFEDLDICSYHRLALDSFSDMVYHLTIAVFGLQFKGSE